MHQLAWLVSVVNVKNDVAILPRSVVIGHQAMIDRLEPGDIDVPDPLMVELTSQPFCHALLPGTWHRHNNPPVTHSPVSRPPKAKVLLQHHGFAKRKTVQIFVPWDHDFRFRAGAPSGYSANLANDLLVLRFRNLGEIGTEIRELEKLKHRTAHLKTVARKIWYLPVPAANLNLAVGQLLVVKVGLVGKAKGVLLKIKRFGPGRRA